MANVTVSKKKLREQGYRFCPECGCSWYPGEEIKVCPECSIQQTQAKGK